MKDKKRILYWVASAGCFLLFLALTAAVLWIDKAPIGPLGSEIGLSSLNGWARDAIGQNAFWYDLTEWLGYLALASAGGLALLGLWQLIRRKGLLKIDWDLYCAAGAYALVAAFYVFFEIAIVNYRPILMEGVLEASYPSSHTMLTVCLSGIAAHQLWKRLPSLTGKWISLILWGGVGIGTVVGRLLSGVHWLTDILGGALLGAAILLAYFGATVVTSFLKNHKVSENKGENYDHAGI
ncbi:MAG: phosphatase PAP2 family protein [Clostridia bacterium]|nr:phosphatase PAP2 family protein [Clostridia bacterium]